MAACTKNPVHLFYGIMDIRRKAEEARTASIPLSAVPAEKKNRALEAIARGLSSRQDEIFSANEYDLDSAERNSVPYPLIKRLAFGEEKLQEVLDGISALTVLPDPVGKILAARELDDDLELFQVSCPIGVIGVIFESRPDALVQISTLCLKSGNAVILKGGSEAIETNRILADIISSAVRPEGIPDGWIQLTETRDDVRNMLDLSKLIDLIIPRGSNDFVKYIMDNTDIPVLGHADGICHAYVHSDADIDTAIRIVVDAKVQYVAVCNALETLLVHESVAPEFLPAVKSALDSKGVHLRGCENTRQIIDIVAASEEDWSTEYLDLILSIKVVDGLEDAIAHINRYGSHHTDAIITARRETAETFMNLVDSANVLWNCSTRFADGYRFGLGAEVGIATGKVHARGPVGMEGLLIYKWKLYGNGQIVSDYSGQDARKFTHRPIDNG